MASIGLGVGGAVAGAEIGAYLAPETYGLSIPIGALIGGALGGALGGTAGAYIDATLLFPALLGRPTQTKGQQLFDIPMTTGSLGAPINFCMGRQNRLSGTVMWVSPIQTVQSDTRIGGKGGGNVVEYEYRVSIAVGICEGPINAVRKVWADGLLIYDDGTNLSGGSDTRYQQIRFYAGADSINNAFTIGPSGDPSYDTVVWSANDHADTVIGSYTPNPPFFVDLAYMVIVNLNVQDWGNRIPNFTFLVEAEEQTLLSDAVAAIWSRSGRPTSEIDVSWIRDIEIVGYNIAGPQSPIKALEPLLTAWDVYGQEINGITTFKHRKDSVAAVIDATKFAAYEEDGSDPIRAVQVVEKQDMDLPREVVVIYNDPSMFWQICAQREIKETAISPITTQISIPMVIDGNTARAVAKRLLWSQYAERWQLSFTLAPSQVHLLESDLVTVFVDGYTYNARITGINRGQNWVIEVGGASEQQSILTQIATAQVPSPPPDTSPQGDVADVLVFMEIGALPWDTYPAWPEFDAHYAVSRSNSGDAWLPGGVWYSNTANGTYRQWDTFRYESTIGIVTEALSGANVPLGMWDLITILTVTLYNDSGTFGGATDDDILGGGQISQWNGNAPSGGSPDIGYLNHLYVGKADGTGEVIAFRNALNIAPNTYQISGLLRGRLGTAAKVTGHGTGEYAVLLSPTTGATKLHKVLSPVGTSVYYKAHPRGQTPNKDLPFVLTQHTDRLQLPWYPTQVGGTRDASNNITISWDSRYNTPGPMFTKPASGTMLPDNFPSHQFQLRIYSDSLGTVLLRQIQIAGGGAGLDINAANNQYQNTYSYTAALQTSDGGTVGNPIYVVVTQINTNISYNGGKGDDSALTRI